jgi:hypothetical protein
VTNIQILAIVIALGASFLAVLTGVLMNNTRLNDVKEVLAAKVAAGDVELHLQIERSRAELNASVADLRVLIEKNHSEMLLKLVDMECC